MRESNARPAAEGAGDPLDVEALKAQIRESAARRRAVPAPPALDWDLLTASLRRVESHADIAAGPPDLPRFRGPWRLAARFLARVVLYLSRFLTSRQREYNHAVLTSLRNIHGGLRLLEESRREELRRLREDLRRLVEEKLADRDRRAA